MSNQKILITGSEGLIGILLQESLRGDGHTVYRCDKKFSYPLDLLIDDFTLYFKDYSVNSIIHLAGYAGPKISQREMEENILMTSRVAESAVKNNIKRIIYSSSIHVYDFSNMYTRGERITTETNTSIHVNIEYYGNEERNVSNYSKSKILSEEVLGDFYQRYDISVLNLRLGAVTKDDKPAENPWGNATWLSHKDLKAIIKKGLEFTGFKNLICISENKEEFIDRRSLEEFLKT